MGGRLPGQARGSCDASALCCWRRVSCAAIPVLAVSGPSSDELEHNRRLLERYYHAEPAHYARLLGDLHAFQELPPARQERERQFDHDLHAEDPATQGRLLEVLERYTDWEVRLPESEQQRIDGTADRTERLKIVKDLRDQEWVDHLPQAERADLQTMAEPLRSKRIAILRYDERQLRKEWRYWADSLPTRPDGIPRTTRPSHLTDFPEAVQAFVKDKLAPMLNEAENDQLKNADGKWPLLARTLAELSDKHPYLPPLPAGPVVRFEQLPPPVKILLGFDRFKKDRAWEDLQKKKDKWPQFALAVADLLKQEIKDKRLPPLGASRPGEFPADTEAFIDKELMPTLKDAERAKLHDAEGRWPDYPLALLEVAHKNDVNVPGLDLPGPREFWDDARAGLPDVPIQLLREFAQTELTPEDRAAFKSVGDDPAAKRKFLSDVYFKKHPEEMQHFRHPGPRMKDFGKP